MTRADVMERIRETANKHGFEFIQNERFESISDGFNWENKWVNFSIWERSNWDMENRKIETTVTVTASVARMGGDTSTYDLYRAAERIKKAADLVNELENMELKYTLDVDSLK